MSAGLELDDLDRYTNGYINYFRHVQMYTWVGQVYKWLHQLDMYKWLHKLDRYTMASSARRLVHTFGYISWTCLQMATSARVFFYKQRWIIGRLGTLLLFFSFRFYICVGLLLFHIDYSSLIQLKNKHLRQTLFFADFLQIFLVHSKYLFPSVGRLWSGFCILHEFL